MHVSWVKRLEFWAEWRGGKILVQTQLLQFIAVTTA